MKEQHDVEFEIPEVQYDFGQDVKFEVRATNKGKLHVIRGQILCEAVTYTGRVLREVGKQHADSRLGKGKTEVFQMTVEGEVFSEYPGTKVRSFLGNPPRAIHQHHGDQPPLIKISCYINFWRSKDMR